MWWPTTILTLILIACACRAEVVKQFGLNEAVSHSQDQPATQLVRRLQTTSSQTTDPSVDAAHTLHNPRSAAQRSLKAQHAYDRSAQHADAVTETFEPNVIRVVMRSAIDDPSAIVASAVGSEEQHSAAVESADSHAVLSNTHDSMAVQPAADRSVAQPEHSAMHVVLSSALPDDVRRARVNAHAASTTGRDNAAARDVEDGNVKRSDSQNVSKAQSEAKQETNMMSEQDAGQVVEDVGQLPQTEEPGAVEVGDGTVKHGGGDSAQHDTVVHGQQLHLLLQRCYASAASSPSNLQALQKCIDAALQAATEPMAPPHRLHGKHDDLDARRDDGRAAADEPPAGSRRAAWKRVLIENRNGDSGIDRMDRIDRPKLQRQYAKRFSVSAVDSSRSGGANLAVHLDTSASIRPLLTEFKSIASVLWVGLGIAVLIALRQSVVRHRSKGLSIFGRQLLPSHRAAE